MFKAITFEQVVAALEKDGCAIGIVDPNEYHAWKKLFSLPCVSKSSLHEFEQSAYTYKWRIDNDRPLSSAGFFLGSAIDSAVTTPALFDLTYISEKIDGRTKEGKARNAEIKEKGLINLQPDDMEKVTFARDHVREHLNLLGLGGARKWQPQVGMWALLEDIDGVKLNSPLILTGMIDICPTDPAQPLYDLKTTSKPLTNIRVNDYAIADYRYGVQAAIYADLFEICTGYERDFAFLFVETELPCLTRVRTLSRVVLEVYRAQYKACLRRIATRYATNDWGTAALETVPYTPARTDWEDAARAERGE